MGFLARDTKMTLMPGVCRVCLGAGRWDMKYRIDILSIDYFVMKALFSWSNYYLVISNPAGLYFITMFSQIVVLFYYRLVIACSVAKPDRDNIYLLVTFACRPQYCLACVLDTMPSIEIIFYKTIRNLSLSVLGSEVFVCVWQVCVGPNPRRLAPRSQTPAGATLPPRPSAREATHTLASTKVSSTKSLRICLRKRR